MGRGSVPPSDTYSAAAALRTGSACFAVALSPSVLYCLLRCLGRHGDCREVERAFLLYLFSLRYFTHVVALLGIVLEIFSPYLYKVKGKILS